MESIRSEEPVMELRIVSIGKTGAGKSHTGNTILCQPKAFQTKNSSASVTSECKSEVATVNSRTIKYIDTPGFLDTDNHRSEEKTKSEIISSMIKCAPGPHAFLILLKVERYTEQEREIVSKITETFGEDALKYAVVLFTHGDDLDEGQTIEEFVSENTELQNLVEKCGGRCHVIDNKYWNEREDGYRSNRVQIERLMKTIHEMSEVRHERYYTNEMLQEVHKNIDSELQRVRAASNGRQSEEQMREEAEERVHTKLSVRFIGVTTGVLLGALLGVKAMVCFVVKKMEKNGDLQAAAKIVGAALSLPVMGKVVAVASGAAVAGALTGAAAVGAVKGVQIAYDAVEGEQTLTGAIKKAAQACMENEEAMFDTMYY